MYDLASCINCGSKDNLYTADDRGLYCDTCADQLGLTGYCDKESVYIIKCMGNSSLYRNIAVTRKQEIQIIKALAGYSATVMEKQLKSLKTVLDII